MAHVEFAHRLDKILRCETTSLARTLRRISPTTGTDYRNSVFKKTFERSIASAACIVTEPLSLLLGGLAHLEDGGPAFYVQERVGKDNQTVGIKKIRSMRCGLDDPETEKRYVHYKNPEEDPRVTRFGQFLRITDLDELPQFGLIAKGELALIDTRCLASKAIYRIHQKRPSDTGVWDLAYTAARPGLLSLNSALNKNRKDETRRTHYDLFYARHASFGLDLYIIYRTFLRINHKVGIKVRELMTHGMIAHQ